MTRKNKNCSYLLWMIWEGKKECSSLKFWLRATDSLMFGFHVYEQSSAPNSLITFDADSQTTIVLRDHSIKFISNDILHTYDCLPIQFERAEFFFCVLSLIRKINRNSIVSLSLSPCKTVLALQQHEVIVCYWTIFCLTSFFPITCTASLDISGSCYRYFLWISPLFWLLQTLHLGSFLDGTWRCQE